MPGFSDQINNDPVILALLDVADLESDDFGAAYRNPAARLSAPRHASRGPCRAESPAEAIVPSCCVSQLPTRTPKRFTPQ